MVDGITIRLANADDAEKISALICDLSSRFIIHEFSPDAQARFLADHSPEAMRQRLTSNFRYHVAENGGELIGVAGVRDNTHLFHLFVAEAFQRKGIGTRLWDVVRLECLRGEHPGVFTVNAAKNAVAMYERLGFRQAEPMREVAGISFVPMKLVLRADDASSAY